MTRTTHSVHLPADRLAPTTDAHSFGRAPAGVGMDRCPYCGGRKRADRPSCAPCSDLPGLEPL